MSGHCTLQGALFFQRVLSLLYLPPPRDYVYCMILTASKQQYKYQIKISFILAMFGRKINLYNFCKHIFLLAKKFKDSFDRGIFCSVLFSFSIFCQSQAGKQVLKADNLLSKTF